MKASSLILICILFAVCRCAAGLRESADSLIADTPYLKVVMVNPRTAEADTKYGCRFLRAGWITELYRKGDEKSLIWPRSIFSYHPAFGYTHEIVPALEGSVHDNGAFVECMKVGVGIIRQNKANDYDATPIRLFPWTTKVRHGGGESIVEQEQESGDWNGYAYKMTFKTVFVEGAPRIEFEQTLRNVGKRRICVSAYVHPFFQVPEDYGGCWYILPRYMKGKAGMADILPRPVASARCGDSYRNIPAGMNWVAAGWSDNVRLVIGSSQKLEKNLFWKDQSCFAVEPFIKVDIPPGRKKSWKWFLIVSQDQSEFENQTVFKNSPGHSLTQMEEKTSDK